MKRLLSCSWLWAAAGCVPDFDDRTSEVLAPRVLAIQAFPAEAGKNDEVELRALVASPDGSAPEPSWSLCVDRKPLSELGPLSARCLASPELAPEVAVTLGTGATASATLPAKVCQLFGPERPDPKAGEPSGRPVDPDPTGGYYQPVLAWLGQSTVLGGVRLACPLSGATREGTVEYNERYRPNSNPELDAFELLRADGSTEALDAEPAPVLARRERVQLRARFAACPAETPEECGGAERYAFYDHDAQRVVDRDETLVVSWFSSAGALGEERSDRDPSQPVDSATNRYVAPPEPGEVRLWAVVRDDRGGVSWRSGRVRIE
jgi:hypothetical protein